MTPIRVLIVGDDPLARAGLAALLADQMGSTVAGQVSPAADLADALTVYRPDAVLWDLGWGSASHSPLGLREADLERLIELQEASLPILALLRDAGDAGIAWTAGVSGLLLREADGETLMAALQAITQGLAVLDPALTSSLWATREPPPGSLVEDLTARELEVLQLLSEGLPNKSIALRMGISEHTVKFHVNAILGKLGAQSRTDAVVRATRLGLILL